MDYRADMTMSTPPVHVRGDEVQGEQEDQHQPTQCGRQSQTEPAGLSDTAAATTTSYRTHQTDSVILCHLNRPSQYLVNGSETCHVSHGRWQELPGNPILQQRDR